MSTATSPFIVVGCGSVISENERLAFSGGVGGGVKSSPGLKLPGVKCGRKTGTFLVAPDTRGFPSFVYNKLAGSSCADVDEGCVPRGGELPARGPGPTSSQRVVWTQMLRRVAPQ